MSEASSPTSEEKRRQLKRKIKELKKRQTARDKAIAQIIEEDADFVRDFAFMAHESELSDVSDDDDGGDDEKKKPANKKETDRSATDMVNAMLAALADHVAESDEEKLDKFHAVDSDLQTLDLIVGSGDIKAARAAIKAMRGMIEIGGEDYSPCVRVPRPGPRLRKRRRTTR